MVRTGTGCGVGGGYVTAIHKVCTAWDGLELGVNLWGIYIRKGFMLGGTGCKPKAWAGCVLAGLEEPRNVALHAWSCLARSLSLMGQPFLCLALTRPSPDKPWQASGKCRQLHASSIMFAKRGCDTDAFLRFGLVAWV